MNWVKSIVSWVATCQSWHRRRWGNNKTFQKEKKKMFLNRTSIDGGGQKLWRTLNHSINYK